MFALDVYPSPTSVSWSYCLSCEWPPVNRKSKTHARLGAVKRRTPRLAKLGARETGLCRVRSPARMRGWARARASCTPASEKWASGLRVGARRLTIHHSRSEEHTSELQ